MAFFELIPEGQMTSEAKGYIEILKKRARSDRVLDIYYAYAKHPPLLKAWVQTQQALVPLPNRFGAAQHIAGMLISHAKGCHVCFDASRKVLVSLGFDEPALDGLCRAPATLPLPERERLIVEFTLRVASDPEALKSDDFRAMERAGFAKDEILEMIGVAGFWNLATTLASAVGVGLREE